MDKVEFAKLMHENPNKQLYLLVYEVLLAEIVTARLPPGEKLSETQIAGMLDISRTPVYEALRHLEQQLFVYKAQGKGFIVSYVDINDCNRIFDVRRAIEGQACYSAAMQISVSDLDRLRKVVDTMKEDVTTGNISNYYNNDNEFHEILVEAADNQYLRKMYEIIKSNILRYRYLIISFSKEQRFADIDGNEIYKLSYREHEAIYNAICMRFPNQAKFQAEYHIDKMRTDFIRTISEQRVYAVLHND